jgi:serine/threonine-protein kinase TTK/MPS1
MMTYQLPTSNDQNGTYLDLDNDNTFMPPILSSYSIALLNQAKSPEKSTPLVTGIYQLDFPTPSNLKHKLSQHFDTKANDTSEKSSVDYGENSRSGHANISQNNSTNKGGTSSNNNSHIGNNSAVFNTSHVSGNSSRIDDEHDSRDLEISAAKPSASSVHTIKRRSIRRLGKILGPPQRARRISTTSQENDININEKENDGTGENHNNLHFEGKGNGHTFDALHSVSPITTAKTYIEKENGVISHLDGSKKIPLKLRNDNDNNSISTPNPPKSSFSPIINPDHNKRIMPQIDILSKQNELELRRRIEEQKMVNQENFNRESFKREIVTNHQYRHDTQKRIPLRQIPVNDFNLPDDENFRKPKIPKLQKQEPSISPQKYEVKNDSAFHHSSINPPPPPPPPAPRAKPDEKRKKTIIINGNEYEKLELLGRGGSSKVYKVKSIKNTRLFAIKKVLFDQFDESCVKGFKGEIDLLLKLSHSERVVKLIDHAIGDGSIYLVMECGDLDLAHVFQNRIKLNDCLDLNFVKYHAIEMLKCVKAVHDAEIVHSDLKPANFLFVRGMLKIIDFGIANAVPDHTANIYRESQIGTPNYMAPEALIEINQSFPGLENQPDRKNTWKVGKPSDVWSCGCIIYQMIYGKPPYGGYSGNQRLMAIVNPQVKIQYPSKGLGDIAVPKSAIELMKKCLSRNPNERWTAEQCLECDFLNPKIVSDTFVRDLVHLAVNYGYNSRANGGSPIAVEVYDTLVDSVIKQIRELNYG